MSVIPGTSTIFPSSCVHGQPWHLPCAACNRPTPAAAPAPTERPRRRRVTGRITPSDRAGKFYDVDLWVEDEP